MRFPGQLVMRIISVGKFAVEFLGKITLVVQRLYRCELSIFCDSKASLTGARPRCNTYITQANSTRCFRESTVVTSVT